MQQGIEHEADPAAVDRAFAQAQQNYRRTVRVALGDSSRANAERRRRDAERDAFRDSTKIRPSSSKRMQRRADSELQELKQRLYNSDYAARQRLPGSRSRRINNSSSNDPPQLPRPPQQPQPPWPVFVDAAACRASMQIEETARFTQLQHQCATDADHGHLCERAVARWIAIRCYRDCRWRAFCYGTGDPPIALDELEAARAVFEFLQLAAQRDRNVLDMQQRALVDSCLCGGDDSVESHLGLWESRAMNIGGSPY